MRQPHPSPTPGIGIDFGTTNSSIARASTNGSIDLVQFPSRTGTTESFRSVLYMDRTRHAGHLRLTTHTGPSAIEHYLDAEKKGRLIQSLKSYLSASNLTSTEILGRPFRFEDLIARILTDLRLEAERHFKTEIRHATVGRPVRFVGAETEADDTFAQSRLQQAFTLAGFEQVHFVMEPEAAAYAYEATLDRDELILIGDFGGGTSDFSLLRVGPNIRRRGRSPQDLLGNSGLGLAGDTFDARIVRHLVSPALGSNSLQRPASKHLPAVPAWIYTNLERWHYLSFLRTRNVTEILKSAHARAVEPDKIEALITLVEEDLGFQLHQAVQRLKYELSSSDSAEFRFIDGTLELRQQVTRTEFESWIAEDLAAIETCIDSLFQQTGIDPKEVDRVFLTGGTSFVPAVRSIFERRFTKTKVRSGNEFTSVARGLALHAQERQTRTA
ncbi:Hsp70 family protein [Acidicapsa dinghuensis]|uniref:Hsp70 family protein n=1 Tax=Acidicapsa dinghuensis TaxID=2218256 RepID=A0ABW1EHP8_9BACT|nr:Hsp70 family protein [Acidicapsa dinghuensis]